MSFLIRKCTGDSLTLIIDHIIDDIIHNPRDEFVSSVSTLFSDSMKSSSNNLHSRTSDILSALLNACEKTVDDHLVVIDFISGVLIQLLHHVRQETADPIYQNCYSFIDSNTVFSDNHIVLLETILRDLAGLRKGSRVVSWPPLFQKSQDVISRISDPSDSVLVSTLTLSVSLLQSSDFESTTKYFSSLVQQLYRLLGEEHFLSFCEAMVDYNVSVFSTHLLQYVQRYIKEFGGKRKNISKLYLFLIKLESAGLLNHTQQPVTGKLTIASNSEFYKQVEALAESSSSDLSSIEGLYNLFVALDILATALTPSKELVQHLPQLLKKIIQINDSNFIWKRALIGKSLSLIGESNIANELLTAIKEKEDFQHLCDSKIFLQGLFDLFKSNKG